MHNCIISRNCLHSVCFPCISFSFLHSSFTMSLPLPHCISARYIRHSFRNNYNNYNNHYAATMKLKLRNHACFCIPPTPASTATSTSVLLRTRDAQRWMATSTAATESTIKSTRAVHGAENEEKQTENNVNSNESHQAPLQQHQHTGPEVTPRSMFNYLQYLLQLKASGYDIEIQQSRLNRILEKVHLANDDEQIQEYGIRILNLVSENTTYTSYLLDSRCIDIISNNLALFNERANIMLPTLLLISNLLANPSTDPGWSKFVATHGIQAILNVMSQHAAIINLQSAGCQALVKLCRDFESISIQQFQVASGLSVLYTIESMHPNITELQYNVSDVLFRYDQRIFAESIGLVGDTFDAEAVKELIAHLTATDSDPDLARTRRAIIGVHFLSLLPEVKPILTEHLTSEIILRALIKSRPDPDLVARVFTILYNSLLVPDQNQPRKMFEPELIMNLIEWNGVHVILDILFHYCNNSKVQESGLMVLSCLSEIEATKTLLIGMGALSSLCSTMKQFPNNPTIIEAVCTILFHLIYANPERGTLLINHHGVEAIHSVLEKSSGGMVIYRSLLIVLSELTHQCHPTGMMKIDKKIGMPIITKISNKYRWDLIIQRLSIKIIHDLLKSCHKNLLLTNLGTQFNVKALHSILEAMKSYPSDEYLQQYASQIVSRFCNLRDTRAMIRELQFEDTLTQILRALPSSSEAAFFIRRLRSFLRALAPHPTNTQPEPASGNGSGTGTDVGTNPDPTTNREAVFQ